jgi:hypothetical protein
MGFDWRCRAHKEALSNLASPFDLAQTKPAARRRLAARRFFNLPAARWKFAEKRRVSLLLFDCLCAESAAKLPLDERRSACMARKEEREGIGADFFINETLEDNNRRSYHHSFFSLKSRRRRCRRLTFHAFDSILYCAPRSQCALGLRAGVVFIVRPRAHANKNTF